MATALVLSAVFIPTAFITGLSGQFYKQFAITIAISTVISAFNSLTLSPALSALLLKDHHAPKDKLSKAMDWAFGWFFRPFNRFFDWASQKYSNGVARIIRVSAIAIIVYGGLLVLTANLFQKVPAGFVPAQDKQYLIAFAQLPEGASIERTDKIIRRMTEIAMKHEAYPTPWPFPACRSMALPTAPTLALPSPRSSRLKSAKALACPVPRSLPSSTRSLARSRKLSLPSSLRLP